MKVSKYLPFGFVMLFIFPMVGLFFSLISIVKDRMNRIPFLLISFFYFFVLIKMPPYGDSYRRFLDYQSFSDGMTMGSFISGHQDFFFYLSIVVFKKIGLPYFLMPASYAALMIYSILASLRNGAIINKVSVGGFRGVLIYIVMLSSFDIINFSLGLRFGLAIALAVYGITTFYTGRKLFGIFLLITSVAVHFSMGYVVFVFFMSFLINVSKRSIIPLSVFSFVLSSLVIPILLSSLSYLSVAKYAMDGYVESDWANSSSNLNTYGVFLVRNLLQFIVLLLFILNKDGGKPIDRFICIFVPAAFLMSISFSAVQRYFVVANLVLLSRVLPMYYRFILSRKVILFVFLFYIFMSGIVLNIYTQRITIIWGQLWEGLYKSPVTLLFYSTQDFNKYIGEVTVDGDWVKNKQK